jgi:HlyD family secretion protein
VKVPTATGLQGRFEAVLTALPRLTAPAPPARAGKWRRWLLGGAAAAVLSAVSVHTYVQHSGKAEYLTARVDRGDIESTISATGSCNAVVTVQVGSQVSGNIIALNADFNTKVQRGQLVARIDPAPFQAKVDQAQANADSAKTSVVTARATIQKAESDIASAQANVATQKANLIHAQSAVSDAKTKLDRRADLFRQGIISQEDRDTAQATYDQAVASLDAGQAQLNAAQSGVASAQAQREVAQTQLASAQALVKQLSAALQQAQLDLGHTEIRAPVDGTVVSRNMDVGQTVAASFQAPTIFLIAQDLTKMQVDTNVDESDVGRVRLGQQANFSVDAYPGTVFPGVVAQIRQAPINVQNVITYDVVVQVSNQDLKLFPGMTANVKILADRASGVLRVPNAALRFRPASGTPAMSAKGAPGQRPRGQAAQQQTIYVLDNRNRPQPVRVKLGIGDGSYVAVTSGDLTEGQQVVVGTKSASSAQPKAQQGSQRFGF